MRDDKGSPAVELTCVDAGTAGAGHQVQRTGRQLNRAVLVRSQAELLIGKIAHEELQLDVVIRVIRLECERVDCAVADIVRQDAMQHVRRLPLSN